MMYTSRSAPRLRLWQRLVLATMYLFVPAMLLYVWQRVTPQYLYYGRLRSAVGLLVSPGVWLALNQLEES